MLRDLLIFGALAMLIESEFGQDIEAILETELTEEEKDAIGGFIMNIDEDYDDDQILEEYIKLLKEYIDKIRQK
jgi:phosphomannomutase